MAKKHHNKGTAALKRIHAEAKRIDSKHPGKKYTTCVKEAAAKYRKEK